MDMSIHQDESQDYHIICSCDDINTVDTIYEISVVIEHHINSFAICHKMPAFPDRNIVSPYIWDIEPQISLNLLE